MNLTLKNRIDSIDSLKGVVLIIMALDHSREFLHASNFLIEDPNTLFHSSIPIFLTRWITKFCAPAFSFLAGTAAYFISLKKSKSELSRFLVSRGIWLIFVEMVIINYAWFSDLHFRTFGFYVIWVLGVSMIALAAIIHLPKKIILIFSLVLIFGHNLLDNVHFNNNIVWAIFHEKGVFKTFFGRSIIVLYPIIPWVAVMSLGYYFGIFYEKNYDKSKRIILFNSLGIICLIGFLLLRYINIYGDPINWRIDPTLESKVISFFHVYKYPPSLLFLMMTFSGIFLFLANTETLNIKVVSFFSAYGKVPFFYYIIHLYIIHGISSFLILIPKITGIHYSLSPFFVYIESEKAIKLTLVGVYIVWLCLILVLYPLCKKFGSYKQSNPDKVWLKYL